MKKICKWLEFYYIKNNWFDFSPENEPNFKLNLNIIKMNCSECYSNMLVDKINLFYHGNINLYYCECCGNSYLEGMSLNLSQPITKKDIFEAIFDNYLNNNEIKDVLHIVMKYKKGHVNPKQAEILIGEMVKENKK